MPFGEGLFSLDRGISPPLVQSDLLRAEADYSWEPLLEGGAGSGPTVVSLDDQEPAPMLSHLPEVGVTLENMAEVNSPMSVPSTTRKHGRPSLSASVTSATPTGSAAARAPRSTKSPTTVKSAGRSTGRKRKAAALEPEQERMPGSGLETEPEPGSESGTEPEPTPTPKKRGRPARAAGAAAIARLAAEAAKKPTRGPPKLSAATQEPIKKASRRKNEVTTNGQTPKNEYEVEEIVDSAIDADTMEHMYLIKWKDYPENDNTWEPRKNLKGALDLVRKFDAKKKAEAEMASKKAVAARKGSGSEGEGEKAKPTRATRGRSAKAVKPVKKEKGPGLPAGRRRRARA
ncbi:Heterochromatin protein 1 [Madurella mycetomatis]|uniref:Heterochromatin protein 1 n=1 Tax=Madurella mycetomatis TaxID=100816 RepID=A0A175WHQ6_9PEZI|nr:Heterochromatin protein 1 [Madurella mycetomatis]